MNHSFESNGLTPGAIVGGGHYSLHVPLGTGGLLWLAQDEEQQRLAVVRFLPAALRQDARALDTLKARMRAAMAFEHENVCRTLEWYEAAAVESFIATEYVEGKPVAEVMNGGAGRPIPWDWLKPVAASVACGLDALHAAGLVHHGLQPENILVGSDKRVKLINAVVTGTLRNPLFNPAALNEPRALRCLSPQQLGGAAPTPADDVYALGATLFELLTGTPVFANESSLLQDIRSTLPPSLRERLTAAGQSVPDDVIEFITACLDKDAARRPSTLVALLPRRDDTIPVAPATAKVLPLPVAAAAAEVLPAALPSELELIKAARDARPRRTPLALAAVILLLLSLAGAWGFRHFRQQEQEKQRMAAAAASEARQRQEAETAARLAEEKARQETAARLKSETDARQAREAARLAEDRRRQEAEARARREKELAAARAATNTHAAPPRAPLEPPTPSSPGDPAFLSIFNGRDLAGWNGDTNYWSVRDGHITAQASVTAPKQRFLLTWLQGNVPDFELHFSYRFRLLRGNKSPNGGVNYRLAGGTNFTCYQFDLVNHARDNGAVCDDRKRQRLAGYGDSVTATSSNKHPLIATLGDTNKLNATRPEDWNKCVIIARGNRLTHYINGVLVADVTDNSTSKRHLNGALALELYPRNTNNPATFLQFTDLKLKRLDPAPKGHGLASVQR